MGAESIKLSFSDGAFGNGYLYPWFFLLGFPLISFPLFVFMLMVVIKGDFDGAPLVFLIMLGTCLFLGFGLISAIQTINMFYKGVKKASIDRDLKVVNYFGKVSHLRFEEIIAIDEFWASKWKCWDAVRLRGGINYRLVLPNGGKLVVTGKLEDVDVLIKSLREKIRK